jgi:hypothetical protein
MKKSKILKGAVVLLIVVAMVFSTVAIADTAKNETVSLQIFATTSSTNTGSAATGGLIIWDNGMNYTGIISSQNFTNYGMYSLVADDFHFEEDTEVTDVHWMAGYWNPGSNESWPWEITFYADRGDGEAPGAIVYVETFLNTSIDSTFIEITPRPIHVFLNKVDLTDPQVFIGCEKYWISIQGIGDFPPQSGWMRHDNVTLLHEATIKGDAFGIPDWINVSDPQVLNGTKADMCFQLTARNDPPTPPEIDGPPCGHVGNNYTWTFHSDDPDGDMVRYHIDWGDGPTQTTGWNPPCTVVSVTHTYTTQGTFTITAYAEDEHGNVGPSTTFTVEMPRDKSINLPFLNFLQQHPNLFQMIQRLFQRLGLY